MAIIHLYTQDGDEWAVEEIHHDGSCPDWILKNIKAGQNFAVYEGDDIHGQNEISRDYERVAACDFISVLILPAGGVGVAIVVSLVISAAVALLAPKPKPLENVNRQQESPNNALSDRKNKARPNQRIVDICGKVKSIPDIIQQEFAKYEDNIEKRVGYYCVGREQIQIEDLKDGDTPISSLNDASAGVYYPSKSPNNSTPDIQVGDPIDEPVVGVYQSQDAIGQEIKALNDNNYTLNYDVVANSAGYLEDLSGESLFSASFAAGDTVALEDIWVLFTSLPNPIPGQIGQLTTLVTAVTDTRITFDISGDPSWAEIEGGEQELLTNGNIGKEGVPTIAKDEATEVGPFRITAVKVDRLLVNCYSPNGMYKEDSKGRHPTTVEYNVYYQKLDDNLDPVGPKTPALSSIEGNNADEKGFTTDIDLGGLTYVEWSIERITDKDFEYNGNVVDEVKLKDVFGLYSIDQTDFGNITTIQTKRASVPQATALKNPELNCIATEMTYKYLGGDLFDTVLTPNTQAMQSLIRLALDPYVGRRQQSELDLDNLLQTQSDIESYFQSDLAGQFSYSFDSTNTTAQEVFFTIANAVFSIVWREGRVLKSWFERPQTSPKMVFTHRSKQPNSETWTRSFASDKDSVELKYIDDKTYAQETLYYPSDRSGRNPLKIEVPGIKGMDQAMWRILREYNKLIYKKVDLEFTSTQEGRLVKPSELISVVKGSRVGSYDGYIRNSSGLTLELSQSVTFTDGDDHYIVLKRRDGTVESIPVTQGASDMLVVMAFAPTEPVYTGNSELKTEFSFGNEARLTGQLMLPQEINPSKKQYVTIKAINYASEYYSGDPVQPPTSAFDDGFDEGFE